jgi:hypothetical protein
MSTREEQYEQLTAYLDDELGQAAREQVERLLQDDPQARRLLEELQRTSRLVASLPHERAPRNLLAAVTAQLERQELLGQAEKLMPGTGSSARWVRRFAVAAGLAFVGTAIWLAWQHYPTPYRAAPIAVADAESGAGAKTGRSSGAVPPMPETPTPLQPTAAGSPVAANAPSQAQADRAAAAYVQRDEQEKTRIAPPPGTETGEPLPNVLGQPKSDAMPAALRTKGATAIGEESKTAAAAEMGLADQASPEAQAGRFDDLLAGSVLTSGEVRQARPETLKNQIVILTDATTKGRLVGRVSGFMEASRIPDLNDVNLPEPVSASEPFYFVTPTHQPGEGGARAEPSGGVSAEVPVQVIANLPAEQAERLLEAMQQLTDQAETPPAWTVNGGLVARAESAARIIANLTVGGTAPPPQEGPQRLVFQKQTDEQRHLLTKSRLALAETAPKPPATRGGFVTLAISIRAMPATSQPASAPSGPATQPATLPPVVPIEPIPASQDAPREGSDD